MNNFSKSVSFILVPITTCTGIHLEDEKKLSLGEQDLPYSELRETLEKGKCF
jgi:hypothetical protein